MKKTLNILFAFGLTASLTGCEKYLDINTDPSNPQVAESSAILPPILSQMVRGHVFDSRLTGRYVQYWGLNSALDSWERHGYVSGSDTGGEMWRTHYWSVGKNVDLIIEDATPKKQFDYVGAAKAIRAWTWQTTSDIHGEMILKEAWEPNRYVFDYDSQEDVYKEVVRLANDAIKDLSNPETIPALKRGDAVYNGDVTKWTKFAYAVLARNAQNLSNKSTYSADKVIEYVDKSFSSNADNFSVPHAGTNSLDGNFYGPLRGNLTATVPGAFTIALLDGTKLGGVVDPRLPIMFAASPDGVYRGVEATFGDPNNVAGNTKRIPLLWGNLPGTTAPAAGRWIYRDNAPYQLATYAELQFIKAEAAFKKGDKALSLSAYQKGIDAHMDFVGVAAADKAKYMTSKAVVQTAAALTLSDIMLQKYIALYGIGAMETWVDMRRHRYSSEVYTGFTLPSGTRLFPDNNGKPAYRMRPRYNSEYVWNRVSLDAIGGNNPDYHTYEIWFMKP
ncbi:MAG: SusD/RagB family nutrient-binding outer membrane lipoprotein [Spirosomataceae bacterium]